MIRVHDTSLHSCKQPRLEHLPSLPSRGIFLAPSGQFKTTTMVSLILDHYRGCFERIYVFSPSVDIDSAWTPVKRYVYGEMKIEEDEQCFFSEFDVEALEGIMHTQHEIIKELKRRKKKSLFGILVVVDDFSDNPAVLHAAGKNPLNSLFTRGRHLNISCWVSAQKLTTISTVIRSNTQFYCVGRLRGQKELQAFLDEISAVHSPQTLLRIYDQATLRPHGFLYVDLTKQPVRLYANFEHRIRVQDPVSSAE